MLTEYCIKLPDEPGQMATLCEALAEKGVNLMTACALTATGAVVAIVTEDPDSTTEVLDGSFRYIVDSNVSRPLRSGPRLRILAAFNAERLRA